MPTRLSWRSRSSSEKTSEVSALKSTIGSQLILEITVSLGKWILRYLFANLIDEEIKRDEAYRQKLNEGVEARQATARANAPTSIVLPPSTLSGWENTDQTATPRANGSQYPPPTPGLAIGLATPGPIMTSFTGGVADAGPSPMSPLEKVSTQLSRQSVDRDDYFASSIGPVDGLSKVPTTPAAAEASEAKTSMDTTAKEDDKEKEKEKEKDKEKEKEKADTKPPGAFGKKFRMSFGTKKLGRSASQATQEKPAVVIEEKAEESESSSYHEKEVDDSFFGVIQKIRQEYDRQLFEAPEKMVETRVTPSLPNDTPVLKLPAGTQVVIQEETSGGSANLYQGTVEDVGRDADIIEQKGPMWLGDVLLQNQTPFKEPVKVSFVLYPVDSSLPAISAADGNNRLNANRMLRVKKILAYVAERIEPPLEEPDPDALKPEEYLELYCNEQVSCYHSLFSTSANHSQVALSYHKPCGSSNSRLEGRQRYCALLQDQRTQGTPAFPTTAPNVASC